MKYFYEYTKKTVIFEEAIDNQKHLSDKERKHLEEIGKSTVHIKTVEYCLDNLKGEIHKKFVKHIEKDVSSKKAHSVGKEFIKNFDKEMELIVKQAEKELIQMLED